MLHSRDFPTLKRPSTLVRAARYALQDYRRERHTKRLLKVTKLPSSQRVLPLLTDMEAELETMRKEGDASYSVSRHIVILAGLMAEMALMSKAETASETKSIVPTMRQVPVLETMAQFPA